jgi:hypothetical protein
VWPSTRLDELEARRYQANLDKPAQGFGIVNDQNCFFHISESIDLVMQYLCPPSLLISTVMERKNPA